MTASADKLAAEIHRLLNTRAAGKSICPSEVARSIADSDDRKIWEPLMQPVRDAAHALIERGEIVATQKGQHIDIATAKGPIRLRRR